VCSGIIVSHLAVGVLSRCVPFVGLLGLLTTAGVIAVCVSALTGPIYYDKRRKDGSLRAWSRWNKVAAVVILVLFIGGYAALMWFLVASGQFKYRETVAQGLSAAPEAFLGRLKGKNFGKQLVRIAE